MLTKDFTSVTEFFGIDEFEAVFWKKDGHFIEVVVFITINRRRDL